MTSSKKKKTSIVRIIIGVLIPLALFFALLEIDRHLQTIPYHRDLKPHWTQDGKHIFFTRWHLNPGSNHDSFEIIKMEPNGKNSVVLYKSTPEFNLYSIRNMKQSGDGKFLNIRLNKQIEHSIEDTLLKIPLDEGDKVESWTLEKKQLFDIFLAYRDDLAAVRRMKNGDKRSASLIEVCNFNDRKPIRSFEINDKDKLCVYADFYGNSLKLAGIVRNIKGDNPEHWDNTLRLFDEDKEMNFRVLLADLHYYREPDTFLGMDFSNEHYLYLINPARDWKKVISNPTGKETGTGYSLSPDKSRIIACTDSAIHFVNIEDGKSSEIKPGTEVVPTVYMREDGLLAYSDGDVICTVKSDGSGMQMITEPSKKSRALKDPRYQAYLETRRGILNRFHEGH